MNIGILLPGFSADEDDWAIPVQHTLVRELSREDDVRVLALRYPHRRDCYRVFDARVCSLGVGQIHGVGRLALWGDALWTLRRLHREQPFDVLHAMWSDETGLIAAWAGKLLNVTSVVSIAGGELVGFDDIGYGLQRSRFGRWIVGQALTGADAVVTPCWYAQKLIVAAGYAVPGTKIHRITLGVDTNMFYPTDEPRDLNRLIHVASLVGVKDQTTLLRALTRLDESVTLDMLGVGSERERLSALATDLGIACRVNFLGAVAHLELPRYYRRAALNVLSSRHEGLGMVTLEAAACGTPTVGTAVGLLYDEPTLGDVVPIGDDAALAEAIHVLLADDQRRAALGRAAAETVAARFSIQRTVSQFRMLYRELMDESS